MRTVVARDWRVTLQHILKMCHESGAMRNCDHAADKLDERVKGQCKYT
jgi:hypothetical protein